MEMETPTYLDAPPRIIVIGDVHGDIGMLCACLYLADVFNTNLEWVAKPVNTIVVQMGDQLDSLSRDTTQEWEKLDDSTLIRFTEKLDTIARKKGGRFISMIGNHELMNIMGNFMYVSPLSMKNSGGNEGRIERYKPGGEMARLLANRNVVQKIGGLLFCHAGILPHHLEIVKNRLDVINSLFRKVATNPEMSDMEQYAMEKLFVDPLSILWNRYYLENNNLYSDSLLKDILAMTECNHMIIGHNPMQHITALYDYKLWITDIGLSRSFSNNSLEVLEILNGGIPDISNDHRPFRIIQAVKK